MDKKKILDLIQDIEKRVEELGLDEWPEADERLLKIKTAPHFKMAQGPWENLGIMILNCLDHSTRFQNDWFLDFNSQHGISMGIDNAIKTAQNASVGFFETFKKELYEKIYDYYRTIQLKLIHLEQERSSQNEIDNAK